MPTNPEVFTEEWANFMEDVYMATLQKIENEHMHMKFSLNMICEMCKRNPDLKMSDVHRMALFGLGYDHEKGDTGESDPA